MKLLQQQSSMAHTSRAKRVSIHLFAKYIRCYFGSPVSKGIIQPDMWGVTPSNRWDWVALRQMIENNGVRNSLLVAPMPTASTSQILGNNECFEAYTSNIYSRRVPSGEFVVVNKHLLHDLTEMGLWSPTLKNIIIYENGSVQNMIEIPDNLRLIYKTGWEIKQKTLVDMAVNRGCYIDQSQSLNIHMDQPNFGKLTSLHFHAWSKGCIICDLVLQLMLSSSLSTLPCSRKRWSSQKMMMILNWHRWYVP